MNYMITIKGVELDSNNLQELIDIAVSEGACPSTEVFCNGKIMRERMIDFMGF